MEQIISKLKLFEIHLNGSRWFIVFFHAEFDGEFSCFTIKEVSEWSLHAWATWTSNLRNPPMVESYLESELLIFVGTVPTPKMIFVGTHYHNKIISLLSSIYESNKLAIRAHIEVHDAFIMNELMTTICAGNIFFVCSYTEMFHTGTRFFSKSSLFGSFVLHQLCTFAFREDCIRACNPLKEHSWRFVSPGRPHTFSIFQNFNLLNSLLPKGVEVTKRNTYMGRFLLLTNRFIHHLALNLSSISDHLFYFLHFCQLFVTRFQKRNIPTLWREHPFF